MMIIDTDSARVEGTVPPWDTFQDFKTLMGVESPNRRSVNQRTGFGKMRDSISVTNQERLQE